MVSQLGASEPPEQASGVRWFSAARMLVHHISRRESTVVEPAFPRPGTQPVEHLENALATWAQLWQTCARETVQFSSAGLGRNVEPAVLGELAGAARRTVVVARVVATPAIQDEVASLLEDADRLLVDWARPANQNRIGASHEAIRAVLERCRRLEDRIRAQASGSAFSVPWTGYAS